MMLTVPHPGPSAAWSAAAPSRRHGRARGREGPQLRFDVEAEHVVVVLERPRLALTRLHQGLDLIEPALAVCGNGDFGIHDGPALLTGLGMTLAR